MNPNPSEIVNLLQNSGIDVLGLDDRFIYFTDPSCILTAFDSILNYAWIVILVLTGFMLAGWAILYIKNGVNINNVFNNAKTIILIFCTLSVVKPVVNFIYGDDLFAKGCDTHQVEISKVQQLLDMRKKQLKRSDEAALYESFSVTDSGAILSESVQNENSENE